MNGLYWNRKIVSLRLAPLGRVNKILDVSNSAPQFRDLLPSKYNLLKLISLIKYVPLVLSPRAFTNTTRSTSNLTLPALRNFDIREQ
jgi:hypothetical protein